MHGSGYNTLLIYLKISVADCFFYGLKIKSFVVVKDPQHSGGSVLADRQARGHPSSTGTRGFHYIMSNIIPYTSFEVYFL